VIVVGWIRNRLLWVAVILLATAAGAVALVRSNAEPADLTGQIVETMRDTLEESGPGQHHHAGHAGTPSGKAAVICGVRVYGYEPARSTRVAEVRKVYGFHLCGVAEAGQPWDAAVKLAGPLILDMSTDPPGIQVVEATADVRYVDRLRQMFPPRYADLAQAQALSEPEMTGLRRRYDDAAGLG
jgi:hypothetical protein